MTTAQKQALIAAKIISEFNANGGDIVKAFDKVIGEGAYLKLAGDVYHTLRGE